MKALVLTDLMKFEYKEVPEPELYDDGIRIRIKACGICGSDIHGIDGSTGRRRPPVIMGHEASGVVEAVGAAVASFRPGDRVTFDSTIYCGKCYYCVQGRPNLCEERRVIGVSCEDYHMDGAMAEQIVVPARIVYKLPDEVSFENAAMVEPVSVAVHAVNRVKVELGDVAVVMGAGMIGSLIVQCLKAAGCSRIIVSDIDEKRLATAAALGATEVFNPQKVDIKSVINKYTDNRGADLGFEAVGITDTVQSGINLIRKGGSFCLVGNVSPTIEFELQSVVTREINVMSSCASAGEYPACLELMGQKVIDVKPLMSIAAPLSEGGTWFKKLYNKEPGLIKVILQP